MDILSYILGKQAGGGGGEAVLVNKNISANGTYNASSDSADGYKKVVVDVPNTYAAGDEGKVVHNGALVSQTSDTFTENTTYDTTLIDSVTVDVPTTDPSLANKIASGVYEDGDVVEVPITTLGRAFSQTSGKFALNLPNLVSFRTGYNFEQTTFTSVRLPLCTGGLGNSAAKSCQNLVTWFAPLMTVMQQAIASCPKLETAVIGGLEAQWEQFKNDTALAIVDIAKPNNINHFDNSFNGCTSLETLIIRSTNVARLTNITAFAGSKFADGGTGGDIYIPKSLYDHLGDGTANDYKAATNWSTINGYGTITWHAIEGSYYETHYADGTVIS